MPKNVPHAAQIASCLAVQPDPVRRRSRQCIVRQKTSLLTDSENVPHAAQIASCGAAQPDPVQRRSRRSIVQEKPSLLTDSNMCRMRHKLLLAGSRNQGPFGEEESAAQRAEKVLPPHEFGNVPHAAQHRDLSDGIRCLSSSFWLFPSTTTVFSSNGTMESNQGTESRVSSVGDTHPHLSFIPSAQSQ